MDHLNHHPTTTTTTNPLTEPTTLTQSTESLYNLALRGSWLTILDTTQKHQPQQPPHDHLVRFIFNVIALSKLRRYSDALSKIEIECPNLDSESYPNLTGSMIPFALRWLHAILSSFLGRPDSIDRHYLLLSFVRSRHSELWRRREDMVASTIISYHCSQKEYLVCVGLLNNLIAKDPSNASLLSKLGYIQLQFGDIEGAKSTFSRVEKLISDNDVKRGKTLVGRNRALVCLVGKDYVSAVREYDECIERDESDIVAINNKALCLMYSRDLADSIKVLENSLERVPTVELNETLVVNLCSMYELAYVNHTDIKKTLSNWITRLAPDDFDSSCTRVTSDVLSCVNCMSSLIVLLQYLTLSLIIAA